MSTQSEWYQWCWGESSPKCLVTGHEMPMIDVPFKTMTKNVSSWWATTKPAKWQALFFLCGQSGPRVDTSNSCGPQYSNTNCSLFCPFAWFQHSLAVFKMQCLYHNNGRLYPASKLSKTSLRAKGYKFFEHLNELPQQFKLNVSIYLSIMM